MSDIFPTASSFFYQICDLRTDKNPLKGEDIRPHTPLFETPLFMCNFSLPTAAERSERLRFGATVSRPTGSTLAPG